MPTAFDPITGADVDTSSEAYRHYCECKWLLDNMPGRSAKHRWLFGVNDRRMIINQRTGELTEDWKRLSEKSITHLRGLEAADRILADAKKIYDHQSKTAA